jgi:hypothetical protein
MYPDRKPKGVGAASFAVALQLCTRGNDVLLPFNRIEWVRAVGIHGGRTIIIIIHHPSSSFVGLVSESAEPRRRPVSLCARGQQRKPDHLLCFCLESTDPPPLLCLCLYLGLGAQVFQSFVFHTVSYICGPPSIHTQHLPSQSRGPSVGTTIQKGCGDRALNTWVDERYIQTHELSPLKPPLLLHSVSVPPPALTHSRPTTPRPRPRIQGTG